MDIENFANKIIGSRIKSFRKSRKITKTRLAKTLEITQQQLDKYEKGQNRISAGKLAIISKRFDISINYFYDNILEINTEKLDQLEKENLNLLSTYYLNIKRKEVKNLILSLTKELVEHQ